MVQLNEAAVRSAARQRLQPDRARARKQVQPSAAGRQHARAPARRRHHVEHRAAHLRPAHTACRAPVSASARRARADRPLRLAWRARRQEPTRWGSCAPQPTRSHPAQQARESGRGARPASRARRPSAAKRPSTTRSAARAAPHLLHHGPRGFAAPGQEQLAGRGARHDAQPLVHLVLALPPPPRVGLRAARADNVSHGRITPGPG